MTVVILRLVDTRRVGAAVRAVRQRRGLTQADLGACVGCSSTTISRIERGQTRRMQLGVVEDVATALGISLVMTPRYDGAELDRLLARRHSLLHEAVAQRFRAAWPGWILVPEVSFSIYGERGVVDLLAWDPVGRHLVVVELKTEIADVNELIGTLDRKRRLAPEIVADRGWVPRVVSTWLIVADGRTNRRRVAAHREVLRGAYPDGGRAMARLLRSRSRAEAPSPAGSEGPFPAGSSALAGSEAPSPAGSRALAALSYWPDLPGENVGSSRAPRRRVMRRKRAAA